MVETMPREPGSECAPAYEEEVEVGQRSVVDEVIACATDQGEGKVVEQVTLPHPHKVGVNQSRIVHLSACCCEHRASGKTPLALFGCQLSVVNQHRVGQIPTCIGRRGR